MAGRTGASGAIGICASTPSNASRICWMDETAVAMASIGVQACMMRAFSSPPTVWAAATASSSAARTGPARSSSASPASVSSTWRVLRRKSSHPTSRSSMRIWRLSAGWDR